MDEVQVPSWGVVAVCVLLAAWLAMVSGTSAALAAPRRIVRRPRRYRGTHSMRVIA